MSALPLVVVAGLVLALMAVAIVARRPGTSSRQPGSTWSRVGLVATVSLGLVSAVAWLASGALLLLVVLLTPRTPGDAGYVLVLKVADVVGWLAIGVWLLRDWSRLRLRVVAPAAVAWAWVLALGLAIADRAHRAIGD